MKTDISRNTYRREKHYNAVRLKQNRLLTDADWNEQVDIQNGMRRAKLRDTYGASGLPTTGGGFQLGATGVDLTISQGRIYVDGILCENFASSTYTTQIDLPGQILPGDGLYLAYLDAWERGVTRLESNARVRESGLGGPDTATRAQLLNQVKLLYIGDGSVDAGRFDTPSEFTAIVDRQRSRMSARTRASDVGSDPCDIGERGGYSSQENRLYRVEIHTAGTATGGTGPATATLKWSRENGTVASELLELNGNSLTVRSIGRDRAISFRAGDWLEITDEGRDKAGERGTLARIQEIVGETLIIDPDSLRHFDGTEGDAKVLTLEDFSRGVVRVRRWDMPGAIGSVPVPAAGTWLELENGIEILFQDDAFDVGDYWLIPARAANRDVEWPRDSSGLALPQPAGSEHRYASLAYVRSLGGVWEVRADLRTELSVLTRPELFYVSGDGQQGMPGEDLATALAVRVGSGPQPIAGAKVRFEIITGTGILKDAPGGADLGATIVTVESDAGGIAQVGFQLDATTEHQQVEAVLLNSDGSTSPYLVRYHANLNLSTAVHYSTNLPGPAGQNLMDGVGTVDDALNRLGEIKVNRAGDTIAGSLTVQQDFDVTGDLTVRGDVIVQDTNSQPGSVALGDDDGDEVIIHAEMDSGHTSDRLVVDDTVHLVDNLDVDGRIGIGTNAPTDKLSAVGIIEAREGGLVFPDGTIQITAGVTGGGSVPTGYCIPGQNATAPDGFIESLRALNAGGAFAQWTARASMTSARQRAAVAVLNGRIYVAGGARATGARTENEEYDPITNLWRSRAPFPAANGHLASVGYQNRMYVFGGSTWSGGTVTGATDASRVYDPMTDTWTTLRAMSAPRSSAVAAEVNGSIYVIGGGALAVNEVFDPNTNTWGLRAPMLTAGSDLTVATLDGKIYVFGGNVGLNGVEVYDPPADVWTTRNAMPFSGFGMIAGVIGNRVHLIGGINIAADLNIYKIYDPATDSWSDGPTGMTLRHNGAGAVVDNTIYYLTGQVQGPAGDVTINEAYSPAVNFAVHCKTEEVAPPPIPPLPFLLNWTPQNAVSAPREGASAVTLNGRAYLMGGRETNSPGGTATLFEYNPNQDEWTERAAMSGLREFGAAATYDDRIYYFGGLRSGSITRVSEVYDPARDLWNIVEDTLSSRFFTGAASVNGTIYVVGGRDTGGVGLKANEAYDPATDSWSARQEMITGRESPGVVELGGKIYAIGGVTGATYHASAEVYDPSTNTWTGLESMPTARFAVSAVVVNERIYVIGGANGSGLTNVVEEYDPRSNSWRAIDALAFPRRYTAATVLGRTIYVIGGTTGTPIDANDAISLPAVTTRVPLPARRASHVMEAIQGKLYLSTGYGIPSTTEARETYEYDPTINGWSTKALAVTARYEAASAVVGDRMYVIGGAAGPTGSTLVNVNEEYDPVADSWAPRTAMDFPRRDAAAASDGTRIYVSGGTDGTTRNYHEIYDPGSDSWITAMAIPTPRRGHAAVVVNGLVYAIGGFRTDSTLTGTNEVYNPATDLWSPLETMPTPRDKMSIFARNGRIYVIGGRTSTASAVQSRFVEEYNPVTNTWRRMPDLVYGRGYNAAALIGDRAYIVGGRDETDATADNQIIIFEN